MLRYINGKLMEGNLSGNGFIDVTKDLLYETCEYLRTIPERNLTALDYSMKHQLLQCIGSLLNYLTNIESIQIECYNTISVKDGAYLKSDKKLLLKSKSVGYNRIKQPLPEGGGGSEEVTKQSEPQSKAGRIKFQILKSSKKLKSAADKLKVLPDGNNNIPEYSNSQMLQHGNIPHSPVHLFRRYHSSDNLLDSTPQASECAAFRIKDLSETCDIHTYDLPSMIRSKLSQSDSDNDMDGYLRFDNSVMEVMPLNDTDGQIEKIKLEVNKTELGERVCVLRDYSLLIGKELDGSIAEYACALDQYRINNEMSDESNSRLCISGNDVNMLLSFKSWEIYTKWKQDLKKNMIKVRYISIHFPNQLIDPGYECIKMPIYERISLYRKDSLDICEGKKSNDK